MSGRLGVTPAERARILEPLESAFAESGQAQTKSFHRAGRPDRLCGPRGRTKGPEDAIQIVYGADDPPNSSASITFSIAVSAEMSWKNWKTIPAWRPRQRASSFSLLARSSAPSKTTRPLVGLSRPVSMFSSVYFPLPEVR